MNSFLRKAMLPAAVAVATFGFIGAFGSGATGVQTAFAADGDICAVSTDATPADPSAFYNNQNGPVDYVVNQGETYGLVFRVEDVADATDPGNNLVILGDVYAQIDSETGSARITSQAEVQGNASANEEGYVWPNVWHNPRNISGSTSVDIVDPDQFNDPDSNAVGNINTWLTDVAGFSAFADDDDNVCGGTTDDAWGFIDFTCIEPGYFHIDLSPSNDFTPNQDIDYTELGGHTLKFYCPGQADSAEISGPKTLETNPVGSSVSSTTVVVTVWDQFDDRIDGAEVTFTTDNCKFSGASDTSPAGGGTTVTTYTDTDTSTGPGNDMDFLANNPLEHNAGTAEAVLDCSKGTPGTANVTAIVQRPGSDIVLTQKYTIVGQTALTGLTLTLSPTDLECGETILAVVKAVDSVGQPVSDGTVIYFTTDTSSGVVGGVEGAQGSALTVKGEAQALIATDPGNSGTHTVIAYVVNAAGNVSAQEAATYTCDSAVAPVVPTVNPPATGTGTGTGSITPPNTGDAGLAAGSSSSSALFVIAGAAFVAIAGMVGFKLTRE